jgi:hypothetical protein
MKIVTPDFLYDKFSRSYGIFYYRYKNLCPHELLNYYENSEKSEMTKFIFNNYEISLILHFNDNEDEDDDEEDIDKIILSLELTYNSKIIYSIDVYPVGLVGPESYEDFELRMITPEEFYTKFKKNPISKINYFCNYCENRSIIKNSEKKKIEQEKKEDIERIEEFTNICDFCYLYDYTHTENCCVCYENKGRWVQLSCDHIIHKHCWNKIKNRKCPLCRKEQHILEIKYNYPYHNTL